MTAARRAVAASVALASAATRTIVAAGDAIAALATLAVGSAAFGGVRLVEAVERYLARLRVHLEHLDFDDVAEVQHVLDLADAAYVEQLSEGYYNVIAVQGADADAEFAQAVKGIVQSDAFKSVIDDPDNIFAGFGKPSSY